jgi:hypothetical protein
MSKNKERIKKLRKLKRELNELENSKPKYEEKYLCARDEYFHAFHVRNLSIVKSTINLLLPAILSAGITISGIATLNGGLPFILDKNKKYKKYCLEYKSNSYVEMNEEYDKRDGLNNNLPDSKLIVYTPWEEVDGQYIRTKRTYNLDDADLLNLINAIKNKNMDSIIDCLSDYSDESQKSNVKLFNDDDNEIKVDAKIYYLDKDDFIEVDENVLKNLLITIVELCIILGVGAFSIDRNRCNYINSIHLFNNNYNQKKQSYNTSLEQLENLEQKIKVLRNKVNNNE